LILRDFSFASFPGCAVDGARPLSAVPMSQAVAVLACSLPPRPCPLPSWPCPLPPRPDLLPSCPVLCRLVLASAARDRPDVGPEFGAESPPSGSYCFRRSRSAKGKRTMGL